MQPPSSPPLPTSYSLIAVHWVDFNRRLDSWVSADMLRFDATRNAAVEQQAKKEKAPVENEGAPSSSSSSTSSGAGKSAPEEPAGGGGHGHRKRTSHAAPPGAPGSDSVVEEDELGTVFRGRKRRADGTLVIEFVDPEHPEHMGEEEIRAHEEVTKVKNVNSLQLGKHRMDAWYFSAIPPEFWCVCPLPPPLLLPPHPPTRITATPQ
jgi:hypothetical protein